MKCVVMLFIALAFWRCRVKHPLRRAERDDSGRTAIRLHGEEARRPSARAAAAATGRGRGHRRSGRALTAASILLSRRPPRLKSELYATMRRADADGARPAASGSRAARRVLLARAADGLGVQLSQASKAHRACRPRFTPCATTDCSPMRRRSGSAPASSPACSAPTPRTVPASSPACSRCPTRSRRSSSGRSPIRAAPIGASCSRRPRSRMPLRRPLIDDFLAGKRPTLMELPLETAGRPASTRCGAITSPPANTSRWCASCRRCAGRRNKDDSSFSFKKIFSGWGNDPSAVEKITTGGTAKWTLASYAERDRELLNLYRAEYARQPEDDRQAAQ